MRAFFAIVVSIITGVLLSMALAIYLPLEQVNRMFITGLATPIFICFFSVWSLRSNALMWPALILIPATPVLLSLVALGLQ